MVSNRPKSSPWSGLIVGAAVGTVVGLLTAPQSGKATRQQIKKSLKTVPHLADEVAQNCQTHTSRWSAIALHRWQDLVWRCQSAIADGLDATQQAHQDSTTDTVAVAAYRYDEESDGVPDRGLAESQTEGSVPTSPSSLA
ncbi:YtxH domain-containing protein [Prochlorothrix hollandica]|uniref:YtxH domain-containing protein n=1 Tax=Prochlorothrix hollandica TaxID=1223 RepID=UPI0003487F71|nr:YtxH domain-containing protein [Prochlorothrix hollandica]